MPAAVIGVAAVVAAMAAMAACSGTDSGTAPESAAGGQSGVRVVTTTSILGDVTQQIVECAGGTVTVLMPIGTDPHDFSASSEQVADMISADLVIANGLGLEPGLLDSMANAVTDGANIFEVGPLIDPIEFGAGGHSEPGHSNEAGEDEHGSLDPHFWFDMNRMADAALLIGAELTKVTGNQEYTTCSDTTATLIRAADGEVRALLEAIPADQRILVTDHEALGYLAAAYGYEIAGTVIPAGTTLAKPSSADLADLVRVINAEGVSVIFTNAGQPSALADAVAAETGRDIAVVPLYVESLGAPDSPAANYIDMMRTNARLISDGLQG